MLSATAIFDRFLCTDKTEARWAIPATQIGQTYFYQCLSEKLPLVVYFKFLIIC